MSIKPLTGGCRICKGTHLKAAGLVFKDFCHLFNYHLNVCSFPLITVQQTYDKDFKINIS